MKQRRYREERIVGTPKQHEPETPVQQLIRQEDLNERTFRAEKANTVG